MTAVLLDAATIERDAGLPDDAAKVVVRGQISDARRRSLAARFPRAEVVAVWPSAQGVWRAAADADLATIASCDVRVEDVPLLDCFRAAWREETAWLRAVEWALGEERHVVVRGDAPSAAWAAAVGAAGGFESVRTIPAEAGSAKRPGFFSRVRRAGRRGVAHALASRLDPSHGRRATVRRAPRLPVEGAVLAASYAHPARAAVEAHRALGGGDAVFVRTGPGALEGVELDADTRDLSLASALALVPDHGDADRQVAGEAARAALSALAATSDPFGPATAVRASGFGRELLAVHVPEVVSAIAAFVAIAQRMRVPRAITGDEFGFCDRAVLHAAKARGIETVSRQHGVLDSHYLWDRVLADRYLAWDEATGAWLRSRDAVGASRVDPLPRTAATIGRRERGRSVVVFLQPLEFVHVSLRDWMRETLPAVVSAARDAGRSTVLKAHPLQTPATILDALPTEVRSRVELSRGASARDLLRDAAVAVTLDSSVCVDCRDAGVPCLSTAWYAGTYDRALGPLGWVEPCATPDALAEAIRGAVHAS